MQLERHILQSRGLLYDPVMHLTGILGTSLIDETYKALGILCLGQIHEGIVVEAADAVAPNLVTAGSLAETLSLTMVSGSRIL